MSPSGVLSSPQYFFPVVVGLTDGILTGLTLGSARIVHVTAGINVPLALRMSAAAALSGAFVLFAGQYARSRRDLVRAERQLNLTVHGRLATTRLGRATLRESFNAAAVVCLSTFLGAFFPLASAAVLPNAPWAAILAALLILAGLGIALARSTHGSAIRWASALVLVGGLLSPAGMKLRII